MTKKRRDYKPSTRQNFLKVDLDVSTEQFAKQLRNIRRKFNIPLEYLK